MYSQSGLRDAFNREVYPNTRQPGAYEASGSFGSASTGFASYQNGGGSEWPSYNVQNSPAYGNSYAMNSYSMGDSSCSSCQDPHPQYNPGSQNIGYGNNNSSSYYGVSELTGQVYEQPATYAMVLQQQQQPQQYVSPIHSVNTSVNNMLSKYLQNTVIKLTRQLRVQPDWVDLTPDGGASWKYSTMVKGNSLWCRVFTKVEVCAERKAYTKPLPHIGNITTTTKIKLSNNIITELQREFPMMSYCPSTKTLLITMDSLEHCLAILALICACQQDKISMNKIKYHNLCKKYLLLTTPGHPKYKRGAKYSLVRLIRK